MNKDPLFGYQGDDLKKYFERNPLKAGDMLLAYSAHGMGHQYELLVVLEPESGKQRRVVVKSLLSNEEYTFFRTGKGVNKKASHVKLLPLVPWVINRMGQQVKVTFDWTWRFAS